MTADTKSGAGDPTRMGYVREILDRWEGDPARCPAPSEAFLHLGHWDEPTRFADRSEFAGAQRRLNDLMLDLASLEGAQCIVDVGCGVGATLAVVAGRSAGLTLVGVNCDDRQLRFARRHVASTVNEVQFVKADACALPLRATSVDRVLAVESVFHFPSRLGFFREAARVLRPDGRLVLSDFVPTDALRHRRVAHFPEFAVEAMLTDGLGAIPDLYGREGEPAALAESAGLVLDHMIDATANVMPSYECLLWQGARAIATLDPLDRAVSMLQWLAREGLMRMEYHVYRRIA